MLHTRLVLAVEWARLIGRIKMQLLHVACGVWHVACGMKYVSNDMRCPSFSISLSCLQNPANWCVKFHKIDYNCSTSCFCFVVSAFYSSPSSFSSPSAAHCVQYMLWRTLCPGWPGNWISNCAAVVAHQLSSLPDYLFTICRICSLTRWRWQQ